MNHYFAPPLPEEAMKLKQAKKNFKRAKAFRLVEKKIKKYEGARLRKQNVLLRADWERVHVFVKRVHSWTKKMCNMDGVGRVTALQTLLCEAKKEQKYESLSDIGDVHCLNMQRIQTLEMNVQQADAKLKDAAVELSKRNAVVISSQKINTTIQNAQSVQHAADYFYAQEAAGGVAFGAEQVFEQAVRPWCTAAISPPPPKPNNHQRKLCIACHEREWSGRLLRDCKHCEANVCAHCDHLRRCPFGALL